MGYTIGTREINKACTRAVGRMSLVIKKQQGKGAAWLISTTPQDWGERDQALLFETRNEAKRAATAIKVSGDWSIEIAPPPLVKSIQ